jgi:hypothetical protein
MLASALLLAFQAASVPPAADGAALRGAPLAAPAVGEAGADPGAAAAAFDSLCLDNAASADAVRRAASAAGYAQDAPMPEAVRGQGIFEGWTKGVLELVLREATSGSFGCILVFPLDRATDNPSVAAAVTALGGLSLKSSSGGAKNWRAKWAPLRAPKGSYVLLIIQSVEGRRVASLFLESRGKK